MTDTERRYLSYSRMIRWRNLERVAKRILSDIKIYSKYGYTNLSTHDDELAYENKAFEYENILYCMCFQFGCLFIEVKENSHFQYMDYDFAKKKLTEIQDYFWKSQSKR